MRHGVDVELVNGLAQRSVDGKGSLSYESHEENGYWVIAVGGLKLSRGLTLEGLTTSFFARNAMAYDTLTQNVSMVWLSGRLRRCMSLVFAS